MLPVQVSKDRVFNDYLSVGPPRLNDLGPPAGKSSLTPANFHIQTTEYRAAYCA